MKKIFKAWFVFIVLCIALSSCQQKPKQCPTCNGTGSITHSEKIALPCQITSCSIRNTGFFNPNYFADVTVDNKGDEDGTFTVFVDFIYKNPTTTHTENGDLFVRAHSQASTTIHYDADHWVNDTQCRVTPPMVVHSTKEICPTCAGTGIVK